jgi:hypothetical protein
LPLQRVGPRFRDNLMRASREDSAPNAARGSAGLPSEEWGRRRGQPRLQTAGAPELVSSRHCRGRRINVISVWRFATRSAFGTTLSRLHLALYTCS